MSVVNAHVCSCCLRAAIFLKVRSLHHLPITLWSFKLSNTLIICTKYTNNIIINMGEITGYWLWGHIIYIAYAYNIILTLRIILSVLNFHIGPHTQYRIILLMLIFIVDTWVTGNHQLCCTRDWCCHKGGARGQHTCVYQLPMCQLICCILSIASLRVSMLHMQHHFLCNISYVVIAESMGKSLKYTTMVLILMALRVRNSLVSFNLWGTSCNSYPLPAPIMITWYCDKWFFSSAK